MDQAIANDIFDRPQAETVEAIRPITTAGYSDPWLLWIAAAYAGTSVSSSPKHYLASAKDVWASLFAFT